MADADDDDDDFLLELLMHKKSNADSAMPTHTAALCSKCLGLKQIIKPTLRFGSSLITTSRDS